MIDLKEIIRMKKLIGVACHTMPDGDALGSVHAMVLALRKIGKEAYILSKDDKVMDSLRFLPLTEETDNSDSEIRKGTDLVLVLDCGNLERVTFSVNTQEKFQMVNIDHHMSNDRYADINYVVPTASSTGELIYELIHNAGIEIDKDMAACLYTAITTDTGSFRYECTTPRSHEIAAELIKLGIKQHELSRKLFDEKSFNRVKLIGRAISSMKSYMNGKVTMMVLKESDFTDLEINGRDTSDIVNFGLAPEETEVTMILKCEADRIRVSVRTKNKVDAGSFAELFKGGGHKRAAGLTLFTPSLEEATETLLKELEVYLY